MINQKNAEKAEQLRAQAFVVTKSGDLKAAAVLFEQAIALDPSHAQSCQLLGIIYSELKEYRKSREALSKYLDLVTDDPKGFVNRGAINLRLNLFDEAIADYTRAVSSSPQNSNMMMWLANAYSSAGQFENAMITYARAVKIDPNNAEIYFERGIALKKKGCFVEALEDFERVLRLVPDHTRALEMKREVLMARHNVSPSAADNNRNTSVILSLMEKAGRQENAGNFSAAIELYSKALHLAPGNAILWNNRGWANRKMGDLNKALADFSQAILREPSYVQAYTNRANILNMLSRPEEALEDFSKVLKIDDRYAHNYYNTGATLKLLQRYDEAIEQFTKAIQLDKSDADYFIDRGLCYEALKKSNDALADFTQAVRIDSSSPMAYFNRGNILYDLKRHETALLDFSKSISLDPGFFMAYLNRAATLEELSRRDEAFQDLLKAVDLYEDHPFLHIKLGYHHLRRKTLDDARYHFNRAKELGHPDAVLGLLDLEKFT